MSARLSAAEHALRPLFSWRQAILQSDLRPSTRLLMLVLSCHMTDAGQDCFPSIATLSEETGLARSTIAEHLAIAKDLGWIKVRKYRLNDAQWAANEYFPSWPGAWGVVRPSGEGGPSIGLGVVRPSGEGVVRPSGEGVVRPSDTNSSGYNSSVNHVGDASQTRNQGLSELINEMAAALKRAHPSRSEPNRRAWESVLEAMGERDKRSAQQIMSLFLFALDDPFWSRIVLSPSTLRKHWAKIELARVRKGKPAPQRDARCAFVCADGVRCAKDGAISKGAPGSPWYCGPHMDEIDVLACA